MKPTYRHIAVLLALATLTVAAQQPASATDPKKELNKEITLEKDFVPVEKKAVKKDKLPAVRKAAPPAPTTVSFAEQPVDITMPTSIPTMMPYGYRTAHNFSHQRGYADFAGGTQMNFAGSLGYRVLDTETTTLALWAQHNSTWRGYNATPMIVDEAVDGLRLKQQFNDNLLGVDLGTRLGAGRLNAHLRGHFDSFNYYGGRDIVWDEANKQSFTEATLAADWNASTTAGKHPLDYGVFLSGGHSGYDKSQLAGYKGGSENVLAFGGTTTLHLSSAFSAGLNLRADYTDWNGASTRDASGHKTYLSKSNYWVGTVGPRVSFENEMLRLSAGVDMLLGNAYIYRDHGSFHANPVLDLDIDVVPGFALFANITGRRTVNCLSLLSPLNRYSDPTGSYAHSFTPFDGTAGLTVGPFNGFSLKLFGGYGITRGDLCIITPYVGVGDDPREQYRVTTYGNFDSRGGHFGAEVAYKYRHLADFSARVDYAPQGSGTPDCESWNSGYSLSLDGATVTGYAQLAVHPTRRFAVELGVDWRGGRSFYETVAPAHMAADGTIVAPAYASVDMKDYVDLHAGARYRFDRLLTVWLQAGNLLNRRQDVVPGMGAQKLNAMAGVGLTF